MLTNKDIIKSLTDVGYTLQEISNWTKIDINILKKMKKNEQVDEKDENQLNNFLRMNIEEVEINKFADKDYRKTHLILAPKGFKKCEGYKNKGKKDCIKINFKSFNTIVIPEHKFQLTNNKWIAANKLKKGDKLKVLDSEDQIISIENVNKIDCCDISIESSYYMDGIISK